MANLVYNYFKKALLVGSWNTGAAAFGTFPVYCMLVGSGYAPNDDTHIYRSSVTNEITGSNYTAGGFALSSPAVSYDTSVNQGIFDAADVLLANVTFNTSAQAAVLYGSTPQGSASDPLMAYIDFTTGQAVTAGTFQITWASGGILALT